MFRFLVPWDCENCVTTKPVLTEIGAKPLPQETHSCWSCGSMRAAHFCDSCGKVQPPAPSNYFAFFGLPLKLNVDVAALEKDFYALSRKLHPDLSAGSGSNEKEQEWSLEQSSLLNDAYRTLRDPIKRTEYLLHLEGVELEEQSKSATEKARASGEDEEADRSAGLARRSLRAEHASRRIAHEQKDGRRRSCAD